MKIFTQTLIFKKIQSEKLFDVIEKTAYDRYFDDILSFTFFA